VSERGYPCESLGPWDRLRALEILGWDGSIGNRLPAAQREGRGCRGFTSRRASSGSATRAGR